MCSHGLGSAELRLAFAMGDSSHVVGESISGKGTSVEARGLGARPAAGDRTAPRKR